MDDHPFRVLGRVFVRCQADLTGTTTVGSNTLEGKSLRISDLECVVVTSTALVVPHPLSDLAWEVTATSIKRRVV